MLYIIVTVVIIVFIIWRITGVKKKGSKSSGVGATSAIGEAIGSSIGDVAEIFID